MLRRRRGSTIVRGAVRSDGPQKRERSPAGVDRRCGRAVNPYAPPAASRLCLAPRPSFSCCLSTAPASYPRSRARCVPDRSRIHHCRTCLARPKPLAYKGKCGCRAQLGLSVAVWGSGVRVPSAPPRLTTAFSHTSGRPESSVVATVVASDALWCHSAPQRVAHALGCLTRQRQHDVAVGVGRRAHLLVAPAAP